MPGVSAGTVTASIVAPTLVRGGDQEIRAEDVIADAETRSVVDEAAEFLTHLLAGGPMEAKLALLEFLRHLVQRRGEVL